MKNLSAKLIVIASTLLTGLFIFPIWRIRLVAPQYPEGLQMVIWLNKITGGSPHDLNNINLLNHYIGMSPIVPGSLPELKLMPWIAAFLIMLGLAAGFSKRSGLEAAWVSLLAVAGIAGLCDFKRWEYQYGHHLNPEAPIKVTGMYYDPPFLGIKHLLNITASSYPGIGFYLAALAGVLGLIALVVFYYHPRRRAGIAPREAAFKALLCIVALSSAGALLTSCGTANAGDAAAINYGKDTCTHCGMAIVDRQFWSQIVTDKGKVYNFDSVACLTSFLRSRASVSRDGWHIWVADYGNPSRALDATVAVYVRDETRSGPMGASLLAFAAPEKARRFVTRGSSLISWRGIQQLVRDEWQSGRL